MIEGGYYPSGAEFDPDAPWNEQKPNKESVEITVSHTLSKNNTITVYEDEDLKGSYKRQCYNVLELLSLFKSVLEQPSLLEGMNKEALIEECFGWVEDDFEVCEN